MYQEAVSKAEGLVKSLGDGWQAHVHENLGWHSAAISKCGRIYVTNYGYRQYSAFLGTPHSHTGKWVGDGTTTKKAVQAVLLQLRKHIEYVNKGWGDLL